VTSHFVAIQPVMASSASLEEMGLGGDRSRPRALLQADTAAHDLDSANGELGCGTCSSTSNAKTPQAVSGLTSVTAGPILVRAPRPPALGHSAPAAQCNRLSLCPVAILRPSSMSSESAFRTTTRRHFLTEPARAVGALERVGNSIGALRWQREATSG
jgi:hypothetical protein